MQIGTRMARPARALRRRWVAVTGAPRPITIDGAGTFVSGRSTSGIAGTLARIAGPINPSRQYPCPTRIAARAKPWLDGGRTPGRFPAEIWVTSLADGSLRQHVSGTEIPDGPGVIRRHARRLRVLPREARPPGDACR